MARKDAMSVPEPVAAAFRAQLQAYLDRECDGKQLVGAKRLGIRQSHISQMLSGKKVIGLAMLLHLRERTGRSIDEWLGLAPSQTSVPYDAVRAIVRAELEAARRK